MIIIFERRRFTVGERAFKSRAPRHNSVKYSCCGTATGENAAARGIVHDSRAPGERVEHLKGQALVAASRAPGKRSSRRDPILSSRASTEKANRRSEGWIRRVVMRPIPHTPNRPC